MGTWEETYYCIFRFETFFVKRYTETVKLDRSIIAQHAFQACFK